MKKFSRFIVLVLLLSLVLAVPVNANNENRVYFYLESEETGYQIHFPTVNFDIANVQDSDVELGDFDFTTIVVDLPDTSSNKVLLFEIVTDNKEAHSVDVDLSSAFGGQTYYETIEFVDGVASVYVSNDKEWGFNYYFKNDITYVTLDVLDKSGETLYFFYDIFFTYYTYTGYTLNYLTTNNVPTPPKVTEPKTDTKQPTEVKANPTSSQIIVNGKVVAFEAYNINNSNYFKLRDIAAAVNGSAKQFEVTWDGVNNAIGLLSETPYTPVGGELTRSGKFTTTNAVPTNSTIYIDGEKVNLTAYKINNNNYFKLRDIAQAFNIGIEWDGASNSVVIDPTIDYK